MNAKSYSNPSDISDIQRLMDKQREIFDASVEAAASRGIDLAEDRRRRYLARWSEAVAFIPERGTVLDIGAGYMPEAVFELLINKLNLDYHAFDANPDVIEDISLRCGPKLPGSNFVCGETSNLTFCKKFDLVFSSHCLEHAIDIVSTLLRVRDLLNDRGLLFMSVPLGFDLSEEHLLFLGPAHWVELLKCLGFGIVTTNISSVYLEEGDLTIVARRSDTDCINQDRAMEIVSKFSKPERKFVSHADPAFVFPSTAIRGNDFSIISQENSTLEVNLASSPLSLVVVRHSWSGTIQIRDSNKTVNFDCFHPNFHLEGIDISSFSPSFKVSITGKHSLSLDSQCAIAGVMVFD